VSALASGFEFLVEGKHFNLFLLRAVSIHAVRQVKAAEINPTEKSVLDRRTYFMPQSADCTLACMCTF
jgi:hypothetical protein